MWTILGFIEDVERSEIDSEAKDESHDLLFKGERGKTGLGWNTEFFSRF